MHTHGKGTLKCKPVILIMSVPVEKEDWQCLPEEGMMLDADFPESFRSSVVVQLEANGALELLVLSTEDTL